MITQEQVLDAESWFKIRPFGMNGTIIIQENLEGNLNENLIIRFYSAKVNKEAVIDITIPIFKGNVITWRNSNKALMFIGNINIDSEFDICMDQKDESELMDISFTSPKKIAIRKIEEAIENALRTWFYSNTNIDFDNNQIQINIDSWFASGVEWRVLKHSEIAQQDQNNGVILNIINTTMSHSERLLSRVFNKKLWPIIDLNSTSVGNKINESFRFSSNVIIKDGEICPNENPSFVCSILEKHAIGLGMNPKRAYLLRNSFEQTLNLVYNEEPIVTRYNEEDKIRLNGLNLLTAVMHLEHYTHEDGIVISESAAAKFVAKRIITQLIESDKIIVSFVNNNDIVSSETILALDGDNPVYASKLKYSGYIEEMKKSNGKRFGVKTNRCWFKFRSICPLQSGDKLTNRHGGKGVVTVIPDDEMPWSIDRGQYIDICIGPESIINRKSMSTLWEMMVNNLAWKHSGHGKKPVEPVKVNLFKSDTDFSWPDDELHNFKQLAQSYSEKYRLIYKTKMLNDTTFIGGMFWMRLDKLAHEIVSSVKKKRSFTSMGGAIDSAQISGQRCNAAKLLAIIGRSNKYKEEGTDFTLSQQIIRDNVSGHIIFKKLIESIKNESNIV